MTEVYRVGYLERLPLGTPYPGIVAYVGRLLGRLPAAELVIDFTGVDLGQSRDPTAIAIVRRVEDPNGAEIPAVEIRLPQQPESTAEPPDLASPEYRDEVIEATKAALRRTISSGGPLA